MSIHSLSTIINKSKYKNKDKFYQLEHYEYFVVCDTFIVFIDAYLNTEITTLVDEYLKHINTVLTIDTSDIKIYKQTLAGDVINTELYKIISSDDVEFIDILIDIINTNNFIIYNKFITFIKGVYR